MSDRRLAAVLRLYPRGYRADRGAELAEVYDSLAAGTAVSAGPASWPAWPATACGCGSG